MSLSLAPAPAPTHRLIPSRFPPIGRFDTVATASDLRAVIELEGWTNDRLVADRIDRLARAEWPVGAAYAAASLSTSVFEVTHHLRPEAASLDRCYRQYTARLDGRCVDIRASTGDGILYDSVRHQGGINAVAYRPANNEAVAQAAHYRIEVQTSSNRVNARLLTA